MAPLPSLRTYTSRKTIEKNSVHAVNALFAENIWKRRQSVEIQPKRKSRQKKLLQIKELPKPDVYHHLLHDSEESIHLKGCDNTFDRLLNSMKFKSVDANSNSKQNLNKSKISHCTNTFPSLMFSTNSVYSPVMTRSKRKLKQRFPNLDSTDKDDSERKPETTVDQSIDQSLHVEKITHYQRNESPSLHFTCITQSEIDIGGAQGMLSTINASNGTSLEPVVEIRPPAKIHGSTPKPFVGTPLLACFPNCVDNDTLSPISNRTRSTTRSRYDAFLFKKSYQEVKSWGKQFPSMDTTPRKPSSRVANHRGIKKAKKVSKQNSAAIRYAQKHKSIKADLKLLYLNPVVLVPTSVEILGIDASVDLSSSPVFKGFSTETQKNAASIPQAVQENLPVKRRRTHTWECVSCSNDSEEIVPCGRGSQQGSPRATKGKALSKSVVAHMANAVVNLTRNDFKTQSSINIDASRTPEASSQQGSPRATKGEALSESVVAQMENVVVNLTRNNFKNQSSINIDASRTPKASSQIHEESSPICEQKEHSSCSCESASETKQCSISENGINSGDEDMETSRKRFYTIRKQRGAQINYSGFNETCYKTDVDISKTSTNISNEETIDLRQFDKFQLSCTDVLIDSLDLIESSIIDVNSINDELPKENFGLAVDIGEEDYTDSSINHKYSISESSRTRCYINNQDQINLSDSIFDDNSSEMEKVPEITSTIIIGEDNSNVLTLPKPTIDGNTLGNFEDISSSHVEEEEKRDHVFALPNITLPSKKKKIDDSITLKPGKSWRRSLSVQRRCLLVGEESNCKAQKGCVCTCTKCMYKNSCVTCIVSPIRCPRLSTRVVVSSPCATRLRDQSILQQSAAGCSEPIAGLSCVPNGIVDEESALEESIRRISITDKWNSGLERHTKCLEPTAPAKEVVLRRCSQTEPLPFETCYSDSQLQHCFKIGEGVYGEVFLFRNGNGGTSVMKVIPIEGNKMVNGEHQKTFGEILSEITISMELSNLRKNSKNRTEGFSELHKVRCVKGRYPDRLLELWDLYDDDRKSENDSPEMFTEEQLYIVLELANGGKDMEAFVFNNAVQSNALFKQIACALAVAESAFEFEHRDLHWGNILITPQPDRNGSIEYVLDGKSFEVPTKGVQLAIIDFTLSRLNYNDTCMYSDLALDADLFKAEGDYQFDIYRLMQKRNGNKWQHYEPYTNILWLHYVVDKMIHEVRYKYPKTKIHKENIVALKDLKETILKYGSVKDFVQGAYL